MKKTHGNISYSVIIAVATTETEYNNYHENRVGLTEAAFNSHFAERRSPAGGSV